MKHSFPGPQTRALDVYWCAIHSPARRVHMEQKNYFFKVLVGKSAQQKQVPKPFCPTQLRARNESRKIFVQPIVILECFDGGFQTGFCILVLGAARKGGGGWGLGRGVVDVGEGLGRGLGRGWGSYASKTPFEKPH